MNFIIFFYFAFSFIISITYEFVYVNNAMIVITQGLIERENLLPVSVFWYYPNFTVGDRLVIHSSNMQKTLEVSSHIAFSTGFYELPSAALERGGSPDNYCVVMETAKGWLADNPSCKSKIQWMYDRRDVLGGFSLRHLIIPGTHQSAAHVNSDDELSNNQSSRSPWIPCQTKSITTQLRSGIRYLDLRPSSMDINGSREYIISHDASNVTSMEAVVREINDFMDSSKDIVIVCFTEFFRGFQSNDDHMDFIAYLEFSFARHTHRRVAWTYTVNQLWAADRRLILSYDHDTFIVSHYMWPPITQYSNDVETIGQLHSHLNELHRSHANDLIPYAALVGFRHFSGTVDQGVFSRDMRSRYWAERLATYLPGWYITEWYRLANIIVVDFYQTLGIVDIAIQLNEKRAEDAHYEHEKLKAQLS